MNKEAISTSYGFRLRESDGETLDSLAKRLGMSKVDIAGEALRFYNAYIEENGCRPITRKGGIKCPAEET